MPNWTRCLIPALFLTMANAQTTPNVAPLFSQRCVQCHGESVKMSNLDLRTRASILKGGDSGPAVVPGNADSSPLFRRITGQEKPAMPLAPLPALTPAEIALVRDWINQGAPLADEHATSAAAPASAQTSPTRSCGPSTST